MVCALYIPEVEFANVSTMEPIVLQSVPHERYNKVTNSTSTRLDTLQNTDRNIHCIVCFFIKICFPAFVCV